MFTKSNVQNLGNVKIKVAALSSTNPLASMYYNTTFINMITDHSPKGLLPHSVNRDEPALRMKPGHAEKAAIVCKPCLICCNNWKVHIEKVVAGE